MKRNIALFMGGNSSEAAISLKSAEQMLKRLDTDLFNVYPIMVNGKSWTCNRNGTVINVDRNDFSLTVDGVKIFFDCAVPMIHGTPGEDGRLQAYLDIMQIPYTTCGMLTSALTFNKYACKTYLNSLGILFPKGKLIRKDEDIDRKELFEFFDFPCFIKPNSGGSSFGVTKIKTGDELDAALKAAFEQDAREVLIEEFIEGTEITCGLVKLDDKITVFPITEIVSKKEFFDVEAKYGDGMSDEITPAHIGESLRADCETVSTAIYRYLNCNGVVRIDYIIRDGCLYFLEMNTVPGMSDASIIPKQLDVMGTVPVRTLYTRLINEAINNR